MKLFGIVLLTIVAFCGSALAQSTDEFSLRIGQQKTGRASKIKIRFLSVIEDSRCPKDVSCVWAGNAKIKVRLSLGRESKEVEINTTMGQLGAQLESYAITLTSLNPYPTSKSAKKKRNYVATFTIRRLSR